MNLIHVAVAVIKNQDNEVLVSLRKPHQHQGDLWEFPGGKLEQNESIDDALAREIKEELGLIILSASPLIELDHHYEDVSVQLSAWMVEHFAGEAQGKEGQVIKWIAIADLNTDDFPVANVAIIKQLKHENSL